MRLDNEQVGDYIEWNGSIWTNTSSASPGSPFALICRLDNETSGDYIEWDGTYWTNTSSVSPASDPATTLIVYLDNPQAGDVIQYDGSNWTNAVAPPAGNDFSGDSNCVALYRFEDGELTADSIGSNTLSETGTPASDTSDYKEGGGSVVLDAASNEWFSRTDANLSSDFPFKSGTSNKTISVCFWVKFAAMSQYRTILDKTFIGNNGSFSIQIDFGGTKLMLVIRDGIGNEQYVFGTAFSTGKWYHCGVTYEDSGKTYRLRIWDYDAGDFLDSDKTGVGTKNVALVSSAPFYVGVLYGSSSYDHDGKLDEVVIFNDILTADEIDQIRQGTYGS